MNNSKLFVSGICLLVLTLAAPLTAEAQRGGGGGGGAAAAVAALVAECHAAASLVAEWARAARVGAVANWNRAGNWNGAQLERR